MTYAGFKSMLYANVTRDDPRIKACLAWIQRNYTLDCNPNMPGRQSRQGLFYYYNVFARALSAWGEPVIYDAARRPHNWRIELCAKLLSIQKPDGSWVNDEPRWLEGDSTYITGLTILTLQAATQRSQ
jgi:squalene-hopene/tetraprenyl-beta-curcumene cyclase